MIEVSRVPGWLNFGDKWFVQVEHIVDLRPIGEDKTEIVSVTGYCRTVDGTPFEVLNKVARAQQLRAQQLSGQ